MGVVIGELSSSGLMSARRAKASSHLRYTKMDKKPLYQVLASLVDARIRCLERGAKEWELKHGDNIKTLVDSFMPSGSGIDCGTKINLSRSHGDELVFTLSYHHMDENGYYDGWTEHAVTVLPSLIHAIDMTINGKNRNDIKDYLYEVYRHCLTSLVWQDESLAWHCSLYEREESPQAS